MKRSKCSVCRRWRRKIRSTLRSRRQLSLRLQARPQRHLSGLLNALDGVSSREGRILFLTTNHPERLDPALIRPGRVDRKVELSHSTPEQARRIFLWFYQDCGLAAAELEDLAGRFAAEVPPNRVCMAAIQEHLLRHRGEPAAAAHEVDFEEATGDGSQVVSALVSHR